MRKTTEFVIRPAYTIRGNDLGLGLNEKFL
jgi:hypothetical protein